VQEKLTQGSVNNMSQESEFPFDRARRVTPEENQKFSDAIALCLGFAFSLVVVYQKH
jgi:hypothetical protein